MSMALAAARQRAEEELLGWTYITNQLLLENARVGLTDVEEPAGRAALEVEYAAGVAALLRSEWTATQQQLQDARNSIKQIANLITHHRGGDVAHGVCADAEPLAESLRRLLDEFTAFAEATQRQIQEQQQQIQEQQQQIQHQQTQQQQQQQIQQQQQQQQQQQEEDEEMPVHSNLQPLYTRILPPPPVNPTALTLLSVRDQVRELRPETGVSPYGIVHTPRLQKHQHRRNQDFREKGEYTPHLAASPLHSLYTSQISPSAVRHHTPRSCTQDGLSSAALAWRERMTSLKAELRDLKSVLDN